MNNPNANNNFSEPQNSKKKKPLILRLLKGFAIFIAIIFVIGLFSDDEEPETNKEIDPEGVAINTETQTITGEATSFFAQSRRPQRGTIKGDGTDTVTILIYMNGSNLETDDQSATEDIREMINAGYSDQVNVLIETLGTKKWAPDYGIASDRAQIHKITENGLKTVKDDMGQLDTTDSQTLYDFIKWGTDNYPADRYILHFWDHGGGPVYGFGYDEFQADDATLTIDEIREAMSKAGIYFDIIGMDCCIMSCLETCVAFYDYCDYTVLCEVFESGIGWYYTDWMKELYSNTSMSSIELGRRMCDDMVAKNKTEVYGDDAIMALIDQGCMKLLYTAWTDFALNNEDTLLEKNYSRAIKRKSTSRVHPLIEKKSKLFWGGFFENSSEDPSLEEYYITDIMAAAESISSKQSDALKAALDETLIYVCSTGGEMDELTGLSVTLPYGDSNFYNQLKPIFLNCGIDSAYVDWLSQFVGTSTDSYYDYSDFYDSWGGWDDYDSDYNWSDWDYYDDGDYWVSDFGWDDDDWFNYYDYDDGYWYEYYDDDGWYYYYDDYWWYE